MWTLMFVVCSALSCDLTVVPGLANRIVCETEAVSMQQGVAAAARVGRLNLYVEYECQSALAS